MKFENCEVVNLFNNGKSIREISEYFKCNQETIRLRLKKEGVNTSKKTCDIKCVHCNSDSRKEGKTKYDKQRYLCLLCEKTFVVDLNIQKEEMLNRHDIIKNLYLVENLSTTEIGKKLGVSSTIPQRILKKYNLTRDIGYAQEIQNANSLGLTHDEYISGLPVFKKYKKNVTKITNKQNIKNLPNNNKRGKCGVKGAYQLDHKYSILEGFKNGIEPEIIGNIYNLEFIPWEENIKKGSKCSITLLELLKIPTKDIICRVK